MPEKDKKEQQTRPANFDMVDVIFGAGLVCLLVGLGLEIGWGWGLFMDGAILCGYAIWLTTPARPQKEGK